MQAGTWECSALDFDGGVPEAQFSQWHSPERYGSSALIQLSNYNMTSRHLVLGPFLAGESVVVKNARPTGGTIKMLLVAECHHLYGILRPMIQFNI